MDRETFLTKFLPLVGGKENTSLCEFQDETLYVTLKDVSLAELDAVRKLPEVTSAKLGRSRLTVCFGTSGKKEEVPVMANNQQIASDVLRAVGGKENVKAVAHCMTRLRFNLKDDKIPDVEEVKKIPGVLGVVVSGGQFQIIIGQNVPKVYDEVCKLGGFAAQAAIEENLDGPKEKLTLKKIGSNILNYLSGSMTPLIPVLMAAGFCKIVTALFGPSMLNLMAKDSDAYILFDFLYDACFYYMPILLGYNAAKKLNIPAPMGAYMGGILLAPKFLSMVSDGTPFTILGINVTMVNYSQSVVPVLLCVAWMALVYKILAKVIPDIFSTIFVPFFTILISAPVGLLALAPLGRILSNLLTGGMTAFSNATGFIGVGVIGAIWMFLVMTGMHLAVITAFQVQYLELGYQTGAIIANQVALWAVWGVALGAFLRAKSKKDKSTYLGFFVSGCVGGISEPTLYGLCMNHTRTFIGLMAGGFVGGCYLGLMNVCRYTPGSSNVLNLLRFLGGDTANFVNAIIASVLSFVVAAVITYFFGFKKDELES